MGQEIDEIKKRINIVELVNEYVQLTPAGSNYKALSPFRSERTPSFMVNPDLQIFKDFGGDKAGDIFTFLMEIEGISFREALVVLAERAGVQLSQSSNPSPYSQASEEKKKSLDILNDAVKYYQAILKHAEYGEVARTYLKTRSLDQTTIEQFSLGFAPKSYTALTKALQKKGCQESELLASGMSLGGKNGAIYDRFRGRVMIPIRDPLGRTVGFTGRVLPEFDDGKMGKYVNSPQTSLFDKSKLLFGLDRAKIHIKQKKRVVLVEGQMDVMMSHQAGVYEVVAVSGTALTDAHITILQRYTNTFCLCFDNDSAGLEACKRSAKKIIQQGGLVQVIPLYSGKDAADLIQEQPQQWQQLVDSPVEFIEYFIRDVITQAKDVTSKQAIAKEAVEVIARVQDPIQKNAYIQKIAQLLGLLDQDIYQLLDTSRDQSSRQTQSPVVSKSTKITPSVRLQRTVLGYILCNSENYDILKQEEYLFTQPVLRSIFQKLGNYHSQHHSINQEQLFLTLNDEERTLLEDVYFEAQTSTQDNNLSSEQIRNILQDALELLRVQYKRSAVRALRRKLQQVKQSGDKHQVDVILKKIQTLTSNLE